MPTVPPSDIADRRHRPAGHQAADASLVPRHASARPRQERAVQHRVGPATGISTNAAWRVQHKLMQAMIERDRRYKLGAGGHGSRSTTPISAVSALGKAPDVVGAGLSQSFPRTIRKEIAFCGACLEPTMGRNLVVWKSSP